MQNFRNLKVWAKAHKVTLAAYKATETFPKTEQYGLTAQIRRSAASVCANIAEGCGRGGRIEFARFLQNRLRVRERTRVSPHSRRRPSVPRPHDLRFPRPAVIEVKRMLASLIGKLKRGPTTDD